MHRPGWFRIGASPLVGHIHPPGALNLPAVDIDRADLLAAEFATAVTAQPSPPFDPDPALVADRENNWFAVRAFRRDAQAAHVAADIARHLAKVDGADYRPLDHATVARCVFDDLFAKHGRLVAERDTLKARAVVAEREAAMWKQQTLQLLGGRPFTNHPLP